MTDNAQATPARDDNSDRAATRVYLVVVGSLDGTGSPRDGYVLRGGRTLESRYLCTYDLFSSIPLLVLPHQPLWVEAEASRILATSTRIPYMMPFITSQFLRRELGDRPRVVPEGWTTLAFVGRFCEIPDDVVFTVEYSVRSAQTAVYPRLGLNREPPAVYKGQYDLRGLYRAFMTLHGINT